jgi:outer membrane lipoprotein-sorting protein
MVAKILFATFLLGATLALGPAQTARGAAPFPDADQLLRDADRARGAIPDGITWQVEIASNVDNIAEQRGYVVKVHGNDTLAEATSPPRNKGDVMLFSDRTIWFVRPGLRKPVSISARQKLTGDAANGDIACTNYARDYSGTVVAEEVVNGEPAYKLDLKAKNSSVTYDRITYWVTKAKHLGTKADFRTVSDKVFKSATFQYGNKVSIDGKDYELVSKMVITDPAIAANVTTIHMKSPRLEHHPPSIFNVNNVLR